MVDAHKRAPAQQDLIEIWRYSRDHWGEAHADAYLDRFDAAVARLRAHPESGSDCSSLRAGYRRVRVGAHHLYYRFKAA